MIGWVSCLLTVLLLAAGAQSGQQATVILGADEDEGMLLVPRQAAEGPDGNIYVLDAGDSHLKVYAPDGAFIRKIAGAGEGPGEFQRIDGATFGFSPDGNLFFTEYITGHRWLTRMKLSGELIGEVSPRLEVTFGLAGAAAMADGSFLVQFSYGSKPRTVADYFLYDISQALVHLAADGRVIGEIVTADYAAAISVSNNGGTFNIPYTPVFCWVVLADGSVVYTDGMSRNFRVYDRGGNPVREIVTELPDAGKVSRADIDAWRVVVTEGMLSRNPAWYRNFGRVVEKYRQSLYDKANLSRLTVTPEGNFLVEGRGEIGTEQTPFWLLDPEGKVMAHVVLSAWRMRISAGFVIFLASDDEGNDLVHCYPRAGTDAEDLIAAAMAAP